jgi:hypothetical protein
MKQLSFTIIAGPRLQKQSLLVSSETEQRQLNLSLVSIPQKLALMLPVFGAHPIICKGQQQQLPLLYSTKLPSLSLKVKELKNLNNTIMMPKGALLMNLR